MSVVDAKRLLARNVGLELCVAPSSELLRRSFPLTATLLPRKNAVLASLSSAHGAVAAILD